MSSIGKLAGILILSLTSACVNAENFQLNNLSIKKIRSVGDYSGATFDNTIELWFTQPLVWPSSSSCTDTNRVYIDSKHSHLISAAYTAFASGRKVNINADDSLTKRGGACELSFLDLLAQ